MKLFLPLRVPVCYILYSFSCINNLPIIQKPAAAFHVLTYETVRSQGEEKPKTHDFGTIYSRLNF